MRIPLPPHARIWFFLADRKLEAPDQEELGAQLARFTASWKSHGNSLSAAFHIMLDHIVLIAVDEQMEAPSGCSIDKAFRLLQDFGSIKGIDFFNRLLVPLATNQGLELIHRSQLLPKIASGAIHPDNDYYDLTITQLAQLEQDFKKPLHAGWALKGLNL
ncbi:MAG: hypothetical protein RL160_2015 [Bacteroidota bacterium]|jgi:hypothetical protein